MNTILLFLATLTPAQSTAIVLKGATIHPAAGPAIPEGVLVVHKGKILAIGPKGSPTPPEASIIDASGKHIIPGIVDTHSHVGIMGRSGGSDGNELSGPVQPGLRALDAVWPADPGLRMALAGGVTTANIMPGSGNVIGGQTVYVKLRGDTIEEMLVATDDGVLGGLKMANGENPKSFNFGRGKGPPATRMKVAALQREQLLKAREHLKKKLAAGDGKFEPDLELEPLAEVLQRKRTVHFHCHRADDLMTALRLAKEFDFEIVLQHATEGHRVARELADRKASVSLTLVDSPGGKLEVAGLLEENAAILRAAGVRVAINSDDPVTESRFYLRTGAIAVRGGMKPEDALRALTLHPAAMLHLDKRLGSLEKGKDADFVVLSGPPFSVYTKVLETWIDGVKRFDRSRQEDWLHQAGGYALPEGRRPPVPPAVTPLPVVKAPEAPRGAPAPREGMKSFVVLAGRAHPVHRPPILDAVLVVEDGVIKAIGPRGKVAIPEGLPVLTAAVVTPGLIDAHCSIGLSGATNTPADQDHDEKSGPEQAGLRVLDGFNPDEALLDFVRREGVTVVHAVPGRSNVLAGQTGVFRTFGRTAEAMTLRFPAGLLVNLGEQPKGAYSGKAPTTRMATAAMVRSAFAKAKAYAAKKEKPADLAMEALSRALAREVPVLFAAHRADDLRTALRLADELKLDARLELASEAYLMADLLAKSRAPVVLHPPMQRIGSGETIHSHVASAYYLSRKKVPFAIATGFEGYVPKTRVLRHEAAAAAVNGLGTDEALEAVTLRAARILGIEETHGSLAAGKSADLVLYDGDCFEHATHVTHTIIAGRVVWDRAEHLKLPFARRAIPLIGAGVGCCLEW
jgi:imidazolonepropionase-like amidohydrolase